MPGPAIDTPSPEQTLFDIYRDTREVLATGKERFPDGKNRFEDGLKEAVGKIGLEHVASLTAGIPMHDLEGYGEDPNIGELASVASFFTEEGLALRLSELARDRYIAIQNEAVSGLLNGRRITVTRNGDSPLFAIATFPEDGLKQVTGPVTGTLEHASTATGNLRLVPEPGINPDASAPLPEHGYNITLLSADNVPQVGVAIELLDS